MRVVPWLLGLIGGDIRVQTLDRVRGSSVDAYDLVDRLPRGSACLAAWNAYVLRTYADKLVSACQTGDYIDPDAATVAFRLYELSGQWVECAQGVSSSPDLSEPLPHWHTPIRSQAELAGMRDTLDVLRVYLTDAIQRLPVDDPVTPQLQERLAAVNAKVDRVDGLWLPRAPDDLRGGIGDALADGLDIAYALGQTLSRGAA